MSSIIRPSPEIERRLKKLEIGGSGSGSLVTNIGDNTYEWTDEYTYIAYASAINNASSEGIITSQQDATGFSFRAISEAGVPLNWLGYWTSKSLVQSGDPSDYIWTDLSSELPASSVIKYYTESTNLLTNIGDPYNLVAGVPWVLVSGSIPASAFWVASRYIINGTQTPWKIVPVKTKQNDLGLIIHENRFTYAAKGLHKVIDLGSFWEQKTGSAIPLGGIVMSRKYDKQTLDKVNRIMASSVEFAMKNPLSSAAFVKQHAQEMEESVVVKHIQLYVNKYSLNLGVEGRKAVSTLLDSAVAQGLILPFTYPIFID